MFEKEKINLSKKSAIEIPIEHKNKEFFDLVIENLTRITRDYQTNLNIINIFYVKEKDKILIPRFFPISSYVNCHINDEIPEGKNIKINHNIIPRNKLQKEVIEYMLENDRAIIQIPPGTGKSVICVYVVAELKKRTFILVHKDALVEQWINDMFLKFSDISKDEIIRLTSSNFKDALTKSIIVTTDQTFISLLKRNRDDFLNALSKSEIGIFIADEVHTTVGAPAFSECSIHIPAKIVYGLSATPYRYDGNVDIIKYHLGEIFSKDDVSGTMAAKVTVILLDFKIMTNKRYKYLYWGGRFRRSRYLTQAIKSDPLIKISIALLNRLSKDRHIIYVAERIKLLQKLYDSIQEKSRSMFTGSSKKETLKEKVTFSTPGKIRDGIDVSWKDALIMSSPISNIEQMVGRVLRIHKDKKDPIIIDLVDISCEPIRKTFFTRKELYRMKKWDIRYFLVNKGKLISVNEENAIEIIEGK